MWRSNAGRRCLRFRRSHESIATTAGLIAGIILFGLSTPLAAQTRTLSAGDRVIVYSPRIVHREAKGEVVSVEQDSLSMWSGNAEPIRLAWNDVTRVRAAYGERRGYWEGGFIGVFVGFIAAEVIVAADRDDGHIDPECGDAHCYSTGFWVAGAAAGALAGAAVGSLFKKSLWRDVPLPGSSSTNGELSASVTRSGAPQASLHIRF